MGTCLTSLLAVGCSVLYVIFNCFTALHCNANMTFFFQLNKFNFNLCCEGYILIREYAYLKM